MSEKTGTAAKTSTAEITRAAAKSTAAKPTRREQIRGMLARKQGASISQLCEATGWQTHSVRAALTGLRKTGCEIVRSKADDGTTIYRITAAPKRAS